MRASTVIELAREDLDDLVEPFLWSDEFLLGALVDAQHEAARRARLFLDSTTTEVARITLVPGAALYALDPRVIRVERARIASEGLPLRPVLLRELDRISGWEDLTGTPTRWCPDYETGKIRLVANPTAAGTLNLTVLRLPLTDPDDLDSTLEVSEHHGRSLRHWLVYRAFMKRDAETFNDKLAAAALAQFEREFGAPQPAYDEAWITRHYLEDAEAGRY